MPRESAASHLESRFSARLTSSRFSQAQASVLIAPFDIPGPNESLSDHKLNWLSSIVRASRVACESQMPPVVIGRPQTRNPLLSAGNL
jgi:hypothetical protein